MARFIPSRAFFEVAAMEYSLGEKIHDRMKEMNVPVNFIGSHNRVAGIPGKTVQQAYFEAKRTLVVGVRKSVDFKSCKPSAHFQLPLNTGCPGMCEYCYLATTLGRRPYLRVYVNIEEILAKAEEYLQERSPKITIFEGAATSDPVPTEYLTGLLARTIEFFGRQPLGRFRFVTKHSDIDSLLAVRHNGHTRFRFSLNADRVIRLYEHSTPSLEERIEAAIKVAQAGYPLGFILAPLFEFPGWRQEYGQLLDRLSLKLPGEAKRNLTFELITHRFTKRAKNNITAIFPQSRLPMEEANHKFKYGQFGYGKYVYTNDTMAEIREFMHSEIKRLFPGAGVEYFV